MHRLAVLLLCSSLVAVAAWSVSRLTAPSPGSPEYQFLRIQIGMSYQEALELLQANGTSVRIYSNGTTKDGRTFNLYISLPAPNEIRDCSMLVDDGLDCWSATLVLGEGGIVCGTSFDPYMETSETLHFLHRVFGH
jgi:hypothetical protein